MAPAVSRDISQVERRKMMQALMRSHELVSAGLVTAVPNRRVRPTYASSATGKGSVTGYCIGATFAVIPLGEVSTSFACAVDIRGLATVAPFYDSSSPLGSSRWSGLVATSDLGSEQPRDPRHTEVGHTELDRQARGAG
jgi:hypothetical protein